MYFWRTDRLAQELAAGRLNERDKMQYLLGGQILYTFFLYQSLYSVYKLDVLFAVEFLLILLVVIVGVLKAYQTNQGNHGKFFLEYFICLAFPLSIKITILVWLVYYAYQLLGGALYSYFAVQNPEDIHKFVVVAIAVLSQALFFWRIVTQMSTVNRLRKKETVEQQYVQ